jgi:hypothetical protein
MPWEGIVDIEVIAVMAELYDHECPFSLMEKAMDEYVKQDKALIFCGSFEKCTRGAEMFARVGITAKVLEL